MDKRRKKFHSIRNHRDKIGGKTEASAGISVPLDPGHDIEPALNPPRAVMQHGTTDDEDIKFRT